MIDVGVASDMTLAVLSFETRKSPARVRFRCDDLHIDEARDRGAEPPFPTGSASGDNTLEVWDLQAGACRLIPSANPPYLEIATTATVIIGSDAAALSDSSTGRRQMLAKAQPKVIAGPTTSPLRSRISSTLRRSSR